MWAELWGCGAVPGAITAPYLGRGVAMGSPVSMTTDTAGEVSAGSLLGVCWGSAGGESGGGLKKS